MKHHTFFSIPRRTPHVRLIFSLIFFFTLSLFFTQSTQGQTLTCPLTIDTPYKSPQRSAVYYISNDCKKRPIKNRDVYFSYFSSWNAVHTATEQTLSGIKNHELGFLPWGPTKKFDRGSLIKTTSDPKVYLKIDSHLFPIATETQFLQMGYAWNQVEDVDARVISKYKIKETITGQPSYPVGLTFKYPNSPRVYQLMNGTNGIGKLFIYSFDRLKTLYRIDRIATLPADQTFEDLAAETPVDPPPVQSPPAATTSTPPTQNTGRTYPLGINLAELHSYSPQLIFADTFKLSRAWRAQDVIGFIFDDTQIPLRSDDYPTQIPFTDTANPNRGPMVVSTLMLDSFDGNFPAGNYTLSFQGSGVIRLTTESNNQYFATSDGPYPNHLSWVTEPITRVSQDQQISVPITPSFFGVELTIEQSLASDPIRNISFRLPNSGTGTFYPTFINRLKDMNVIRFMLSSQTSPSPPCDNNPGPISYTNPDGWLREPGESGNPACETRWSARTKTTNRTQTVNRGMALEYSIDIANQTGVDPWFTIPHAATDNYIREYAKLVKQRLNPNLKPHLELSNEVWNYASDGYYWQYDYFTLLGKQLFDTGDEGLNRQKAYVQRAFQLFDIFEQEFGTDKNRLVKILGGQSAGTFAAREIYAQAKESSVNPKNISFDAFAIAPYLGYDGTGTTNGVVSTEQQILDQLESNITAVEAQIQEHKALADQNGVKLFAYEGGAPLLAPNPDDPTMLARFIAASKNPRMYTIYDRYFDTWFKNGGDLFAMFVYVGHPSPYGSWGVLDYMDQPLSQAHKYRALTEYATGKIGL